MIHYITPNGLDETWVANEMQRFQAAGLPVVLHSLRGTAGRYFRSDRVADLHRETRVVYPIPPLRLVWAVMNAALARAGRFWPAFGNALFGRRESARARLTALAQLMVACDWVKRNGREPASLIHAQMAHSSATIAMYAAWLLDVPFGFTGHAVDLFRDRVALEDKVRRADLIACISTFHQDFYKKLGARPEQLVLVYTGTDLQRFQPRAPDQPRPEGPPHIVSAGRLIPKKGFGVLIEACRILAERGVPFRCTIAGGGPLATELRTQIDNAKLADRVHLTGQPIAQEDLPAMLRSGDLFCLPCVPAPDGDMDGLPITLMEAMACGLPAVSTRLVGIPDLVIHNQTGLLVEPNDAASLADALQALIKQPELAQRLAVAGRRHVSEQFNIETCVTPLMDEFRRRLTH
jgi:glycosyltransferase involved in cell wall biosynthesis